MLQSLDETDQLDEPAVGQPVSARVGGAVGPRDGNGDPPGGTALADQDGLGTGAAALEDDGETLAGRRVVRVSDEDRVRSRARPG